MRALRRLVATVLLAMALAVPLLAAPSTAEYLSWLQTRRQLWVQEMKQMEAHEQGQYKNEYHRLSERMVEVRQQAQELKSIEDPVEQARLREQLFHNVDLVEQGLEFLLSETPELAEKSEPGKAEARAR
jgi:hypothetical protein